MTRQIFIVSAHIVDANGTFNFIEGYPKQFDSNSYEGDVDKAQRRADGDASTVWADMCKKDTRKLQCVNLQTADGLTLTGYPKRMGSLNEPEPEPES